MRARCFSLHGIARAIVVVAFALVANNFLAACVQVQCSLNSDCPEHSSCIMNQCISRCGADRDCPAGQSCNINGMCVAGATDAGADVIAIDVADVPMDTFRVDTPMPIDTVMPPNDTPMPVDTVMPPNDTPMPVDVPMGGTRGYLDSCANDADCMSGMCTATAPHFCTRACSVASDCADGQICAGGRCQLDDTGTPGCNTSTGAPCLQYCYGGSSATHCTHECTSTAQCPAGYACAPAGGIHVCVQVEIPCSGPTDCPSGLGFCGAGGVGCTANCVTAADCPRRLPGLAPYTCESVSGQMVCVPPSSVQGSGGIGATCSLDMPEACRSEACDDVTSPPTCNEGCTANGGCGPGHGCSPEVSGAVIYFVCLAAGRAWVNESCARSSDCYTALCDTSNYCSKLCSDGLCPSGMTCEDAGASAADGTRIRLCRR
jgi:hypothetical protein